MILIFCYPHVLHKEIVRLEDENISIHPRKEKKHSKQKKGPKFSTTFSFLWFVLTIQHSVLLCVPGKKGEKDSGNCTADTMVR